jgi:hypothetical protein
MNCARPIRFVVAVAVVSFSAVGCGGGSSEGTGAKGPSGDSLPLALDHESCDVTSSSVEKIDTNGDGKPDIVRVTSGGREVCRMVDLNHDDKPDSFVYFDASGNMRRRESDFDRDGRIDEIAYYNGGVIARKDRETNLDGKLDTWDFYEGGKIHHRMRDSDGDGKVDQWWTWANPDKIECAVIASDHNGDGKPDPNDIIDVCAVAAAPGAFPTAAPDGGAPSAPTGASAGLALDGGTKLAASTPAPTQGGVTAPPSSGASAAATPDAGVPKKAAAKPKKDTK